jgi:hypothetical protein
MLPGAGKRKGSAFERQVCVSLSLWMSKGANEDLFWRSAASGGRSTVAAAKGKRLATQAGDISAIHPLGSKLTDRFLIECKSYKDLNFAGLLLKRGKLAEFWLECRKQAVQYQKAPMLIAKQNQQPIIVCLSREGQQELGLNAHWMIPSMGLRVVLFDQFIKAAKRPT